jgi:Rad52/22 family double-strand break repair protein
MSGLQLNDTQRETLLKPINPRRVLTANNQSHIPAYDVAAHLTRVFGFGGWTKEILSLTLINEEPITMNNGKPGWTVTYSCTLRLTVIGAYNSSAFWEDGACGTSTLPQRGEAHDMAMKSSISYALKRCAAFGLGDQFGLSLYNRGMTDALVRAIVGDAAVGAPDVTGLSPTPLSMGNDERQEETETPAGSEFSEPLSDLVEGFRSAQFTRSQVFDFVKKHLGLEAGDWDGELSSLSDIHLVFLGKELDALLSGHINENGQGEGI